MLHVFLLQVVDYLVGALWILLVKIVRDLNERVCCTAHRRQYDESWFT
ncbi:Uncharacterised protein [Segatella copri]|nr:Uncharacterised protein [Segatella copri]